MDFIEPKRNIFSSYALMWRRGLDFRGLVGRRSYWLALALHFPIMCVLFSLAIFVNSWIYIAATVYSALSLVPFISMTARRLHDTGRSGALAPLALVGIGLCFCMSGSACLCVPIPTNVYGPPHDEAVNKTTTSAATIITEYFDPVENIEECVYGPPEWSYEENGTAPEETEPETPEQSSEAAETEETREETEISPAETTTEKETAPSIDETTLPPETETQSEEPKIEFNPQENIDVCVYGPPEWFE